MTGSMFVKRLTKSGNYVSDIDWDKSFICSRNPNGYFKMLIQPITNSDLQNEIRYMKVKGGYIVSGEGYIIDDYDESDIDRRVRYHKEKWDNLIQTEVFSESDLW